MVFQSPLVVVLVMKILVVPPEAVVALTTAVTFQAVALLAMMVILVPIQVVVQLVIVSGAIPQTLVWGNTLTVPF